MSKTKLTRSVSLPKVDEETPEKKKDLSFMEKNKTLEGLYELHRAAVKLPFGLISTFFFAGAERLVRVGAKRTVSHNDLFEVPRKFQTDVLWDGFEPIWKEELKNPKPSLLRALRKKFLGTWMYILWLQTLYAISSFVIPIVLPYMLDFVFIPTKKYWLGYMYTAIVFGVSFFGSVVYYRAQYLSNMLGVEIRSIFSQLVYRKTLTMTPNKKMNSGYIVNLIANDSQFFADTLNIFNSGVTAPIQIIVATGVLWWHIGPYSLLGIGVFILLFPVTIISGKRIGILRGKVQAMADRRLKFVNELINGIRIVKFYAWERAFVKNVTKARDEELSSVGKLGRERAVLIMVMTNTTTFVTIAIFIFYGLLGPDPFTPGVAYSVLSVISLLRSPFFILPLSLSFVQQYVTTLQRLEEFVLIPDMETKTQTGTGEPEIKIKDGSFTWEKSASVPTIQEVNIHVPKGGLHMVVGSVGSGKSTIAMAALGEVHQTKGERSLIGSLAYVPQEAWIMNATLKENILFGESFDAEKYDRVLEASALKPDLNQLPFGDRTEIGERGINLSGGQKQRVSFARALYANRDVYIFDDPFSAVDTHVGKHLFEQAVQGYLKGKTILLITNQLQYLPSAETIYVLKEGKQVAVGNLETLRKSSEELQRLLESLGQIEEKAKEESEPKTKTKEESTKVELNEKKADTTKAEDKKTGLVSWRIYSYYIKEGGIALGLLLLSGYILFTAASIVGSWWISQWTSYPISGGKWGTRGTSWFVWIYVGLLLSQAVFVLITQGAVVPFSLNASRSLHNLLLYKVTRAPTSFFDVTPVGRIINRFAKELSFVDFMLPINISQLLNAAFSMVAVFAAMIIGSRWLILIIVPLVVVYFVSQTWYRRTAIELQRLEAISRAPLISHIGETLSGTVSIRSYKMDNTFKNMNAWKVDYNVIELHAQKYCQSWFGLILDIMGQVLVLATLLAISFQRNYARDSLDVGFAGIAMSYLSGLTFLLSQLNFSTIELETRMNSVERIKEYEELPEEAPEVIESNRPPKDWPKKGVVEFQEYSLAYRKGENILNNISATFEDKHKVGIVGRTGAGKSSLLQALFRMVEPSAGTIVIDGVDITKIGLRDLRSKLSIIPQDPVLFIGSLRYNLDPFGEHNDKDLWDALQMVRLKKPVQQLDGKLDEPVQEKGSNFSVGQRQLICMARALLRRSKILLMDEATASVDITTDALIQKMVRKHFKDVTVLTIAHRLNTVMDSTKVMVLNKGSIAEYDAPAKLLENSEGYLTGMVDATGPNVAVYLRKLATGEISIVEALKNEEEAIARASVDVRASINKTKGKEEAPKPRSSDERSPSKLDKKEKKAKEKKEKKDKEKEEKKEKKEKKEKEKEDKKEEKKEKEKKKKDNKNKKAKKEESSDSEFEEGDIVFKE